MKIWIIVHENGDYSDRTTNVLGKAWTSQEAAERERLVLLRAALVEEGRRQAEADFAAGFETISSHPYTREWLATRSVYVQEQLATWTPPPVSDAEVFQAADGLDDRYAIEELELVGDEVQP